MENYYLLAVMCCLLPFVLGGFWFAWHDNVSVQQKKNKIAGIQLSPVLSSVGMMYREYSYDLYDLDVFPDPLLSRLKKVNLYNPAERVPDMMDVWFKKATPKLMHDGKCLAYINHYGHIEDTFWKNVVELNLHPEADKEFQQLVVSCYRTNWGIWHNNFDNLLYHFGKRYSLLPEIEIVLKEDKRLCLAKETYYLARKYSYVPAMKRTEN